MRTPKLSIITWDGGFRESFHLVDFVLSQEVDSAEFEFIWSDYYGKFSPELKAKLASATNCHTNSVDGHGQWHVGQILNSGAQAAKSDLLLFLDGDVAFSPTFITELIETYKQMPTDLAVYFLRYDELKASHTDKSKQDIAYLQQVCQLFNPENCGAGLLITRALFEQVCGYETHSIFEGPGWIHKDMYTRLINSGAAVKWEPTQYLYHPWHPGTLPTPFTYKQQAQSHVLQARRLQRSKLASDVEVTSLLESFSPPKRMQFLWFRRQLRASIRRRFRG
ncbi:MAG: glycosyltransferase [Candidatus Promineifilaceae bacterium]